MQFIIPIKLWTILLKTQLDDFEIMYCRKSTLGASTVNVHIGHYTDDYGYTSKITLQFEHNNKHMCLLFNNQQIEFRKYNSRQGRRNCFGIGGAKEFFLYRTYI